MVDIGAKIFTIMVIIMMIMTMIMVIVIHIIMDQTIMVGITVVTITEAITMVAPQMVIHLMKIPQNSAIVFLAQVLEKLQFMQNQLIVQIQI